MFKIIGVGRRAFTKDVSGLGTLEWCISQSYLLFPATTSLAFSACARNIVQMPSLPFVPIL